MTAPRAPLEQARGIVSLLAHRVAPSGPKPRVRPGESTVSAGREWARFLLIERSTMLVPEKRRIVLMLRWVLIIALAYLVVFSAPVHIELSALCVALLLTSSLVLTRLPERAFHHRAFDLILVTVDIALITTSLWISGRAAPDFFFMFFFVIFIAALGERIELTALGAVLAAAAYLFLLQRSAVWDSALLLRLPFFFVTALTYGYLASAARQARARARTAEEVLVLKETFLGTMSHEMRSPLNVIVGYGEMLHSGYFGTLTFSQREAVAKIAAYSGELLELIDRTLKVSHLESGAMPVHWNEVRLDEILEEVRVAAAAYEKEGVCLELRSAAGIPPLVTDRLKLKEVVTNLVTNALKYTELGAVTVQTRWLEREDVIEVIVQDTGIGMTPEVLASIFEPFTRAPETGGRCKGGVGLGLYIVRRLLDLLHGAIRVASEPGRGSTFTVRVPRQPTATRRAA
jgi:signal transduction histidine kinase